MTSSWSDVWNAEVQGQSDRAIVVLIGSMIEERLRELCKLHVNEPRKDKDGLLGRNGAVRTFYALNEFAFRVGAISEDVWIFLDRLREIRNIASHSEGRVRITDPPLRDFAQTIVDLGAEHLRSGELKTAFTANSMVMQFLLRDAINVMNESERSASTRILTRVDLNDGEFRLHRFMRPEVGVAPNAT